MIRTVARKLAALLVGLCGAWLVSTLTGFGVDLETALAAVDALEAFTTAVVLAGLYFLSDEALARVKRLFPADWAERFWKDQAGDRVDKMGKDEAKVAITAGRV